MPTQHTAGARTALPTRFTLGECNAILPLVRSVASELVERRMQFRELRSTRKELAKAHSPEGLGVAISDIDAQILEHEDGILRACEELSRHGLTVHRLSPLVVHFPGKSEQSKVMFCWSEGEPHVAHHHDCEEDGLDCGTTSKFIHPGLKVPPPTANSQPIQAETSPSRSSSGDSQ